MLACPSIWPHNAHNLQYTNIHHSGLFSRLLLHYFYFQFNLSLKQQLLFSSPDYVLPFEKAPFGVSTPFSVRIPSGPSCSRHMLGYALLPGSLTERSRVAIFIRLIPCMQPMGVDLAVNSSALLVHNTLPLKPKQGFLSLDIPPDLDFWCGACWIKFIHVTAAFLRGVEVETPPAFY